MGNKPQNDENHDKVFMANFGKVMGGLGVIFAICLIAAGIVARGDIRDNHGVLAKTAERLAPIGTVITDPDMLLAAASATAAREPYTGAQVVERVCAACHNAGILEAPKTGDAAAWNERYAKGLDVLVQHSIEGFNSMPPRGGDSSLSDDEVRESVKHLLKESGVSI